MQLSCPLYTTMNSFKPIRLSYDKCDPSDAWIITGIGHSKLDMSKIDVMNVNSLSEYDAGCREHENCLGHICRTPHGMLLVINF
jgi:hypothetical protein